MKNKVFYLFFVLLLFSGCMPSVKTNLPQFVDLSTISKKTQNYKYLVFKKNKLLANLYLTERFFKKENEIKYKLTGEYKEANLKHLRKFTLIADHNFYLENFKKEIQIQNNKRIIEVLINKKMAIIKGTYGKTKTLSLKLNEPVFENDAVLLLVQYIDFPELQKAKNKKPFTLPVLISQLGAISHSILKFQKITSVEINNQKIPCYLISLQLPGEENHYACYAKNENQHTLLTYYTDNFKFILANYKQLLPSKIKKSSS